MDIGNKLKNARTKSGLTQEKVAAEIGVSRQSVSNWENGRSYPDIVSVIKLSDLYSVSLDELLKEDKKMINHLDEATNTVKSRRRFALLLDIGIYMLIWTAAVIFSHVIESIGMRNVYGKDMLVVYIAAVLYLALPVTEIVISLFIGLEKGREKWLFTLFFGVMHMLLFFAAMGVWNIDRFDFWTVTEQFDFMAFIGGAAFSAAGMGIGTLIRHFKIKKQAQN